MVEEVHNHLQEMLDSGTICPSQSAWCNVVVLVRKKDVCLCCCIDFYCFNAHTKKDFYPLLRIQEALESLVGAGHFSCLDLKSGFWQIKMNESSKIVHCIYCRQLRFLRVWPHAFWLVQCTSHMFQWLIQNCLRELNLIYCLIYPGWHSRLLACMAKEHLHHLHVVFDWFREHNLKLKPSKWNFLKREITYLVHWVSEEGVQPSNLNLEAIVECALPQTYTEVHTFLGLVGHYRRFIKGFACITQPLNELLAGEGASQMFEWVLVTCRHLDGFWSIEESTYDGLHLGFCQLHWSHSC